MRILSAIGCVVAGGLAGCSHYPIPDNVSPYKTEEIVRYARCEMRHAIKGFLLANGNILGEPDGKAIKALIKKKQDELVDREKAKARNDPKARKPPTEEEKIRIEKDEQLVRLTKVSSAYTFDFNITEHNTAGGGVGFNMPWTANAVDAKAVTALDLTRQGSRVFGAEDSWEGLITNDEMCKAHSQRAGNVFYPLTGSIGAGALVRTFIDIEEQGGAKDNFVDTLTFTTLVSGGAEATLRLEPVPNQFRLVSANAGIGASRADTHKLTISLAFPSNDPRPITDTRFFDGYLNAPFERPAPWRARYNLCVQDARARENAFKQLRLSAPEIYCFDYADKYAPPKDADRPEIETAVRTIPTRPPARAGAPRTPGQAARETIRQKPLAPSNAERHFLFQ